MKKNFKKCIVINIFLLVFVLIISEFVAFYLFRKSCAGIVYSHAYMAKDNPKEYIRKNMPHYEFPRKFDYEKFANPIRHRVYYGDKSRPVVTIGCSYTDGVGLDYNQTFAAKINKYTNRTTYNRGISASGPQLIYRQLKDKNFQNDVPDAEYIIYPFIYHHLTRIFRTMIMEYGSDFDLSYVLKNGKLQEKSYPFWFMYWSFLLKSYSSYKDDYNYKKDLKKGKPLFMEIMRESFAQMKELYPNSKFVLLEVPEGSLCYDNYVEKSKELNNSEIEDLRKIGIIYINAEELVGHKLRELKYRIYDKEHPSELFWEEITPALVKKLNL